jgi:hypothetical protein
MVIQSNRLDKKTPNIENPYDSSSATCLAVKSTTKILNYPSELCCKALVHPNSISLYSVILPFKMMFMVYIKHDQVMFMTHLHD